MLLFAKIIKDRPRAAAASKMECFVITVNGFQPLTIITKHSVLVVAAALDPPLIINDFQPSTIFRSIHQRCPVKKGVLRNFAIFTGKHLRQSLFFNKVKACNFIKKETVAQVFSCEFCEISKSTYFTVHVWMTAPVFSPCLTGF